MNAVADPWTRMIAVAVEPEEMDIGARKQARDASLVLVDKRLAVWAAWAKENRQVLGYPTISSLFRVMMDSRRRLLEDMVGLHITAQGKQTQSFREDSVYIPEAIAEVDAVVARLPRPLNNVITANYFTYGPIEVRAKAAKLKRSKFFTLLESAKWAVWVGLDKFDASGRNTPDDTHRRNSARTMGVA